MAEVVAVTGGHVVPVLGKPVPGGTVLLVDGKIEAVGTGVRVPRGARRAIITGE